MELNKVYQGNCMDLFKEMEDESIDCCITSPPYWQLRDYKWNGQWGLEPTFKLYLEHLWSMMNEVYRILKPTGTAWINLGDTYGTVSGSMDGAKKYKSKESDYSEESFDFKQVPSINKCLLLIPHRFAIGCIDSGWIVRNDIVWAKRNGMPESVTDRFSKKHEYFFLMVKQEKYYFDLDAVRDKHIWADRDKRSLVKGGIRHKSGLSFSEDNQYAANGVGYNEYGKNPGSVSDFWDIPTQPSSDEHYAAYNDKLIGKPIVAGCPKGGIILDPFAGTATTGCRALELGRNFIGFEGSKKFVDMGNKNLLPYIKQGQLF
jgi:site-specific DNA-methyltransferase (cytosine-N4-specific)